VGTGVLVGSGVGLTVGVEVITTYHSGRGVVVPVLTAAAVAHRCRYSRVASFAGVAVAVTSTGAGV
jgi:hypothetical protein